MKITPARVLTFLGFIVFSASCVACAKTCIEDSVLPIFDLYDEGPVIKEPLVRAASKGNLQEVRRLLEDGHNVNAESKSGFTALAIATRYEYTDIVLILLSYEADVWYIDRYGIYPLETAVFRAEVGENIEIVEALVAAGADPDAKSPGTIQTPRETARYVGANDLLEAMQRGEQARADHP